MTPVDFDRLLAEVAFRVKRKGTSNFAPFRVPTPCLKNLVN